MRHAKLLAVVSLILQSSRAGADQLPPDQRCTGRWTGTMSFNDHKTAECNNDVLAAYREFDITVRAGAAGFEAEVAKPAGMKLDHVGVSWNADGCVASVGHNDKSFEWSLSVSRTPWGLRYAGVAGHYCSADGVPPFGPNPYPLTFVPDDGTLPPPPAQRVALSGAYALEVRWSKARCPRKLPGRPAAKETFRLEVDRKNGDELRAVDLAFPDSLSDTRTRIVDAEQTVEITRTGTTESGDHEWNVSERLMVRGAEVTGTAEFSVVGLDPEDRPVCKSRGKIRGTLSR